ncbi:Uncharacterised protein [Chryseobacterium nakagawai]|uniref:DUF4373 domain-containing protein n=1 Tax=Chryseobacterium nakagawai TaxID=1241982 RepID=A0AAD1DRR8_CHRNA|nr:Lin1244/Lin1753 domain-containing protein [Chryseobacterium nakagawai]AZA91174.1 DUF4373 domain-containing protein [Chryseobacterium nakagawai]VEH22738.1 Uncharacterised protein [Chryseobacterium nakagawai]
MSKKDSYYFSHDSNARNDEKLLAVRMKLGAEGYGIYFMILERLRDERDNMSVKDYNILAFDFRVSSEKVKSVIEDFGLFEFTDDKKSFFSKRMVENMNFKNEKSEKARKSAEMRWNKSEKNANALPTQNEGNALKERKVKESKVKESNTVIDIPFSPSGDSTPVKSFKQFSKQEFYESLKIFVKEFGKDTVRDFFDYWTEPSASGKMRFQLEKTWSAKGRLGTWKRNEPKFGGSNLVNNKIEQQNIPGPWHS